MGLLNALLQSGARPVDVAHKTGIKPQEITCVFDLQHATKIDTLAAALAAMGYELRMEVVRVS